jgi:hypothetical protein
MDTRKAFVVDIIAGAISPQQQRVSKQYVIRWYGCSRLTCMKGTVLYLSGHAGCICRLSGQR